MSNKVENGGGIFGFPVDRFGSEMARRGAEPPLFCLGDSLKGNSS